MRGQIISADFMAAVFLFMVVFAALLAAWYSNVGHFEQAAEIQDMERIASRALDAMVRSGGYPENWESSPPSASTIGLASRDRRLDANKVSAFMAMDYSAAKERLKTEGYDFYFSMEGSGMHKGLQPGGEDFVAARRMALYNGSIQPLEIAIWRGA